MLCSSSRSLKNDFTFKLALHLPPKDFLAWKVQLLLTQNQPAGKSREVCSKQLNLHELEP